MLTSMKYLSFKPYIYNFVDEDGERYSISLIALYYKDNIIRVTDYHQYVGDKTRTKHLYSQNQDEVRRVCNFFNYALFNHYFQYKAKSIAEIPFDATQNYIMKYASTKSRFNEYPSAQSVEKERNAVCLFMANISKYRKDRSHFYAKKIKKENLNIESVHINSYRKERSVWEYEIQANYLGKHEYKLVRDIPQKAISILLKWVNLKAPELYFAVLLQLCAGLREGEVVNVRRADSKYYGGVKYTKENGEMTSFEIDLRKNFLLRSDGKDVGSIKKERRQSVYPVFLPLIQKAYEQQLAFMSLKKIEVQKPMFVNERANSITGCHMAITKSNYCSRITNITQKCVIPELLKSDDVELKMFAEAVNEGSWGLHAFRHWYTVQLVLNNEDATSIAYWRGDSSTKAAFTYLQNKGALMKKYTQITEKISTDLFNVISDMENVNARKNKDCRL